MKKYLSIFAFAVTALVCLSSCGSDAEDDPIQPTPQTVGVAERTGNINVIWVQLWKGGPKFAEYNVGANSATEYGGLYSWGSSKDMDPKGEYKEGESALTGTDDTATNLWGSNWRMPTQKELQSLLDNCDVEWTDNYNGSGKAGGIFTGKGNYASNSVFFPAAGYYGYGDKVTDKGIYCDIWSSTPYGSTDAYYLYFNSSNQEASNIGRTFGFSVRAVLAE